MSKLHYMFICILLLVFSLFFTGCKDSAHSIIENADGEKDGSSKIYVGFIGPWEVFSKDYNLWPGINLAIEEINANGGVLGKKIVPLKHDNFESVYEAKALSLKLANSKKVSCIVACNPSDVAIPCAIICEHFKMLMIAPMASAIYSLPIYDKLKLVYQNCPTIDSEAEKLLSCAKHLSCKNIIIYNALEQHYAELLGNTIENIAFKEELRVAKRAVFSIYSGSETYEKDLREMMELYTFDGIIVIGPPGSFIAIAKKIKKLKMNVPVLSGMTINCKPLIAPENIAFTEGIIFTSFNDASDLTPESKAFYQSYQKRYKQPPSCFASLGYGTVKALAYAIEEAKSTKPQKIAEALDRLNVIKGVPGPLSFASNPEKLDDNFILKTVKDGKFTKYKLPKKK